MKHARPAVARREWIALAAILLASLALRLALLPHRWINPDEGAHLMDGRLLLDGQVPLVDFDSRQVLYVYILAGWLKLTGFHLATARLLPLGASLLVGLLIFALARRLFGTRPAVFATAVYSFFPLSVLWSANVHMQPITLVFACLGFYCLAGILDDRPVRSSALAGVCFGLMFYVRESALAAVAAAVLFVLVVTPTWLQRMQRVGALACGFLAVSAIMVAGYSRVLSPAELWDGPLNPISLPLRIVGGEPVPVGPEQSVRPVDIQGPSRYDQQTLRKAVANIRSMAGLGLFLFVGLAASLGALARRWSDQDRRERSGYLLVWLWFGFTAAAYGVWVLKVGFYPQYFTEMIPPLAIAFGAVVPSAAERWAGRTLPAWIWIAAGLALGAVFLTARLLDLSALVYLTSPGLLLAAAVAWSAGRRAEAAGALAVLVLVLVLVLGGGSLSFPGAKVVKAAAALGALAIAVGVAQRSGRRARWDFALVALAAGAAVYSVQRAGRLLSVSYQCVWPPDLVTPVAAMIREHTQAGEEVMSGAVAWDFEADRRPFRLISHPLKFLARVEPWEEAEVEQGMATAPPAVVVLDGYTELTFGRVFQPLPDVLKQQYDLLGTWEGGRHPVRVFRLRAPAPAAP
jgi:4-amino-4-deoxy-L-arabinose transferase-like glycosyltransferase